MSKPGKLPFWQSHQTPNLDEIRGTARQAELELERDRLRERAKTVPEDLAYSIEQSVKRRIQRMNEEDA